MAQEATDFTISDVLESLSEVLAPENLSSLVEAFKAGTEQELVQLKRYIADMTCDVKGSNDGENIIKNLRNEDGRNLIDLIIIHHHDNHGQEQLRREILQLLLKIGIDVNTPHGPKNKTTLQIAQDYNDQIALEAIQSAAEEKQQSRTINNDHKQPDSALMKASPLTNMMTKEVQRICDLNITDRDSELSARIKHAFLEAAIHNLPEFRSYCDELIKRSSMQPAPPFSITGYRNAAATPMMPVTTRTASTVKITPAQIKDNIKNLRNSDGRTLIHLVIINQNASKELRLKIIQDLIEIGINVDIPDNQGATALMLAASHNEAGTLRLLYQYTTALDAFDSNNDSVLHYATSGSQELGDRRVGNIKAIKFLVEEAGIDVNIRRKGQRTPLHRAAYENLPDVVEYLLGRPDIRPNTKGPQGKTALHDAVLKESHAVIPLLARQEGALSTRDKNGNTPLHTAANLNKVKVVKILIRTIKKISKTTAEKTTLLDQLNKNGKTALMLAAVQGNFEVVALPVDAGATVDIDRFSETQKASLKPNIRDFLQKNTVKPETSTYEGEDTATETQQNSTLSDSDCKQTDDKADLLSTTALSANQSGLFYKPYPKIEMAGNIVEKIAQRVAERPYDIVGIAQAYGIYDLKFLALPSVFIFKYQENVTEETIAECRQELANLLGCDTYSFQIRSEESIQKDKAESSFMRQYYRGSIEKTTSLEDYFCAKKFRAHLAHYYDQITAITGHYGISNLLFSPELTIHPLYVLIFEVLSQIDDAEKETCEQEFYELLGISVKMINTDSIKKIDFLRRVYIDARENAIPLAEIASTVSNVDIETGRLTMSLGST